MSCVSDQGVHLLNGFALNDWCALIHVFGDVTQHHDGLGGATFVSATLYISLSRTDLKLCYNIC